MEYIKISFKKAMELMKQSKYIFTFINGFDWLGNINYKFWFNKQEYTLFISDDNISYLKKVANNDIIIEICKHKRFWEVESVEKIEHSRIYKICDYSISKENINIRHLHQIFRWLDNTTLTNDKLKEIKEYIIKCVDNARSFTLKDIINKLEWMQCYLIYIKKSITLINGETINIYWVNSEDGINEMNNNTNNN